MTTTAAMKTTTAVVTATMTATGAVDQDNHGDAAMDSLVRTVAAGAESYTSCMYSTPVGPVEQLQQTTVIFSAENPSRIPPSRLRSEHGPLTLRSLFFLAFALLKRLRNPKTPFLQPNGSPPLSFRSVFQCARGPAQSKHDYARGDGGRSTKLGSWSCDAED
jgi:hypothetical protein